MTSINHVRSHHYNYRHNCDQPSLDSAECIDDRNGICDGFDNSMFDDNNKCIAVDDRNSNDAARVEGLGLPGPPKFNFDLERNSNFFKAQHENTKNGAKYLIRRSQFENALVNHDLHDLEVKLHLDIASLCCNMTGEQRNKLTSILSNYTKVLRMQETMNCGLKTAVPMTPSQLRKMYVKGKYAILPSLPYPKVIMLKDHAYVSPKECIADLLGHGVVLDILGHSDLQNCIVSALRDTERARQIVSRATSLNHLIKWLILYGIEWSDGCEPSTSIKSNRNSIWVKTLTISPTANNLHSMEHTYPIAIGLESDNHEEVERRFAADLEELGSGKGVTMYHGGIRKMVNIHFELFCTLQDQPERRSANYIMLGTSNYTARWGVAGDFAAVVSGIPACKTCWSNLLQDDVRVLCEDCVNWDTNSRNGLMDFKPPLDYPESEVPSSGKLSPKRLTYAILQEVVETAHEKFVNMDWTKKNVQKFLTVHGVNTEACNAVLERANNCLSLTMEKAYFDTNGPTIDYDSLLKRQREQPEMFERWSFPALWNRGCDLDQHIDVAMHLVFLGVMKTTIIKITEWLKIRVKHAAFTVYANGIFESVQRYGLNWCRTMPYKNGTLGGWVSENFLAAARLCQWFYSQIAAVAKTNSHVTLLKRSSTGQVKENRFNLEILQKKLLLSYAFPTAVTEKIHLCFDLLSFNKWNKYENVAWLRSRSLDITGNADDIKKRVSNFLCQEGGPPDATDKQGGGDVDNITHVICAMTAMVSRIMQSAMSDETVIDMERHIKIFLTTFHTFDHALLESNKTTGSGTSKPTWLTSHNFMCLLNLPTTVRKFGPMRNLWEGGGQGEKMLQKVKPFWYGYRKNWAQNILYNMLKNKAIARVEKQTAHWSSDFDYEDGEDVDDEDDDYQVVEDNLLPNYCRSGNNKKVHRYKSLSDLQSCFGKGNTLSSVLLKNMAFVCLFTEASTEKMIVLNREEDTITIGGSVYHKWSLGEVHICTNMFQREISNYCLFLPRLTEHGLKTFSSAREQVHYTVIDSDWNAIQRDGRLQLPRYSDANYKY